MKQLAIKHARRKFTAVRDSNGIPHLQATTWPDVLYGLGYMHALDRPTQMLFARTVASGRSAELISDKPQLVETDRFFRRVALYTNLEREVSQLPDEIFGQLTVYCEGVNDGLKDAGRTLPMWATGYTPTPWNQVSVLLVGQLLNFGGLVVGQQQNERILFELVQAGVSDDKMRELFHPLLDTTDFDLLRQLKISSQLSDDALELISDLPRLAGSNAWAVAPSRSATGHALLASDPHLEVNRLPSIWYEAVLEWHGHYVLGATLPGCPLFAVARTEKLSWGVTYLKGDTSDYFIEDCREGGETGWQYRRSDRWHDFERRVEQIVRKGHGSEELVVYSNPVGTLESNPTPGQPGYYLSTKWIGDNQGAGSSIGVWLDVVASNSVLEAMERVRECPLPTLNWIFADREGHIGQQANGWFPKRNKKYNGLLPIPAWDEKNHWQGRLDESVLPRSYDPRAGFVATANEDPVEGHDPSRLVTMVVPDYRKRRIIERLRELPQATVQDMQQLQYDVVSLQARELLTVFLPHLAEGRLKEKLTAWDLRYNPESIEATMFVRLYRHVLLEIFGHEHGIGFLRMLYLCTRIGFSTMVLTAIDKLLFKEESLWWQGRSKGELIRRAGERVEKMPDETWAVTNGFHFTNRFLESKLVGRAFGLHTTELPMPGCHATVFQGHLLKSAKRETTFAPSYHFVTDLGADEAWTNLPGGPSESGLSGFYKNDLIRWRTGQYKRLGIGEVE